MAAASPPDLINGFRCFELGSQGGISPAATTDGSSDESSPTGLPSCCTPYSPSSGASSPESLTFREVAVIPAASATEKPRGRKRKRLSLVVAPESSRVKIETPTQGDKEFLRSIPGNTDQQRLFIKKYFHNHAERLLERARARGKENLPDEPYCQLGSGRGGIAYQFYGLDTFVVKVYKNPGLASSDRGSILMRNITHEHPKLFPRIYSVCCEVMNSSGTSEPLVDHIYGNYPPGALVAVEVMAFVKGKPLTSILEQPISPEKFLKIATQLAHALSILREKGIVYGDLKPDNIMVDEEGNIKIIDFGTTRLVLGHGSHSKLRGTSRYMPMEREYDDPDQATKLDSWSLGVVLHRLLNGGQYPFNAGVDDFRFIPPTAQDLVRCKFPARTPPCVKGVIRGLLKVDVDERISTTEAFLRLREVPVPPSH